MTIEQLLCPAVIRWEAEFRKHLNESNISMSEDEIDAEFDKWLVENEDLINQSVKDNIDHINETIERNRQKFSKKLNEKFDFGFDDDNFANEDDEANHYKRNKLYRLLGVVTSVASVLVFIFTEDMRAKMVIIDRWTLLMVVLLFVNVVTFYLGRRWQEDEDEEEVQQ